MFCKHCGKEIPDTNKFCPECGKPVDGNSNNTPNQSNEPKPKKKGKGCLVAIGIVVVLLIIIIAIAASSGGDSDTSDNSSSQTQTTTQAATEESTADDGVPTEYRSALNRAQSYSDNMHMSKVGIYDQLTSEYGDQFSAEAAQYAVDNVEADWNSNALETAKN